MKHESTIFIDDGLTGPGFWVCDRNRVYWYPDYEDHRTEEHFLKLDGDGYKLRGDIHSEWVVVSSKRRQRPDEETGELCWVRLVKRRKRTGRVLQRERRDRTYRPLSAPLDAGVVSG